VTVEAVTARFPRRQAAHPDRGGSDAAMAHKSGGNSRSTNSLKDSDGNFES
jgi:hypothetical protein